MHLRALAKKRSGDSEQLCNVGASPFTTLSLNFFTYKMGLNGACITWLASGGHGRLPHSGLLSGQLTLSLPQAQMDRGDM